MEYRVSHRSSFEKDLKSLKKQKPLKKRISQIVEQIIENPNIGEDLVGNWSGFMKYKFHAIHQKDHDRPKMRLFYVIYECCSSLKTTAELENCRFPDSSDISLENCQGLIDFVFVKTREDCNNLYERGNKEMAYVDNLRRE